MHAEVLLECEEMLPLVSKPRSERTLIQERLLSIFSRRAIVDRQRGFDLATSINFQFHDIILPQDVDAVAWNEMFLTSVIVNINKLVNPDKAAISEDIETIYGMISGCEFNMIAFADAALDEQKPTQEFAENLIDGCIACIVHPEVIRNYVFPDDPKYQKAKAALVYAHYTGVGLQRLHQWALDRGKESEYITSYLTFLSSVRDLAEAEKLSYLLQKNPQLTPDEYDYIKKEKSVYIVDSALDLILPLNDKSQKMKFILKDLWGKSKDIFRLQLLDDIADLFEDLPDEMTISSYFMENDTRFFEKEHFLTLVEEARLINDNPLKLDQLNRLRREMVKVLWQSNIIPTLFHDMKDLRPNLLFLRQVKDSFGQIKGYQGTKATVLLALSAISILQIFAVGYVERKIKKLIQ